MTTNERIARWRFGDIKPNEQGRDPDESFWFDGELCYSAIRPNPEVAGAENMFFLPFTPDTDITLWHGPEGILAKIEEKGLVVPFLAEIRVSPPVGSELWAALWVVRRAEAPQLAAALDKVIEEAPDA